MRFQLRVLGLVGMVAVVATGATSWITLGVTSRLWGKSEEAARREVEVITQTLVAYGRQHGTWEGVDAAVTDLTRRTGQRIRLVTEYDEVVVDSDNLAGRAARPPATSPTLIDPRPVLDLPAGPFPRELAVLTGAEIDRAIRDIRRAACLTRSGSEPETTADTYGTPSPEAGPDASRPMDVQHCGTLVGVTAQERTEILGEALACARMSSGTFRPCLTRLFTDRISPVAPVPLLLYLGAVGRQPLRTLAFPLLVTASVVMVVAVAGGVLLSRRVLRPVGTLTTAARRFGDGDLATRVRVSGHDELAELGCSFNRMAESIQSAEERQRRMVSDVAHELRTPLANLRGYLEALKDGVIAPAPEVFTSLHDEAVLQQLIVEDLQTLALAEAGTLTYQRTLVDLAELLEGCRAAHQAVAAAGEIRLVVRQPGPARVVADHGRLRQVLSNLITNAIRHTQADGTVTLAAESHGTTVIIKVSDTGCGIAEADLPCVFDRFWRADAARRRSTGGSGLGLAIARQIVLDHGGTITVASQVGQGTTFTVTLPGYDPAR